MAHRKKRETKSKRSVSTKRKRNSKRHNSTRRERSTKFTKIPTDDRLETALKYLREGRSQKRAAEIGMVSVGRFRRFLHRNKLAKFRAGRWRISDRRVRQVAVISEASEKIITVRGFSPASLAMRHRAAFNTFIDSNDVAVLAPFEGLTVTDITKQKYPLETRPNVLLRMANTGSDAEMKIYRLID
jgi:hypothetical protein